MIYIEKGIIIIMAIYFYPNKCLRQLISEDFVLLNELNCLDVYRVIFGPKYISLYIADRSYVSPYICNKVKIWMY